jgi:very-short-patch-repair endonuclease
VGMDIIRSHAKQLRRQLTREERRLWTLLRSRRLSQYKFRRQHPVDNYILDFACCEARLAVELDGGQHDERQEYDRRRTLWLNKRGWRVLRFWNNELLNNEEAVLERIIETLHTHLPSPRPSP